MEDERTYEEEVDVITLTFDNGEEQECEIMGVFDYDGQDYIAMLPLDDTDDVYIYGYNEISEEEYDLFDIEDDKLFKKVVAEFEKIMEEDAEE